MGYDFHFGPFSEYERKGPKAALALCDLPYGTSAAKWDECVDVEELKAWLLEHTESWAPLIFFAAAPFDKQLYSALPMKWFRHEWIWEKPRASGHLNAKKAPMRAHETIMVFRRGKHRVYNPEKTEGKRYTIHRDDSPSTLYGEQRSEGRTSATRYPRSVIRFATAPRKNNHPTEKPVDLLRYLVRTYSNPGDTVADPTMGSASCAEAALLEGRSFFGSELDPKWEARAGERAESAIATTKQLAI